ncbi:MAG: hypothetical protein L0Z53_13920 [Acidobacteriales bacterium]|nr:hypothetical protein [Terriglobales bacterium]
MNTDYIYWTFSAAAQSIAAFVAFLLTGYALVHTLMEAAREKDDSLEDIHASLRLTYHKRLTLLAWLTGAAVVFSLIVVYLNRSNAAAPGWFVAVVSVINIAAIVGGLAFVVTIVDPRRYQKAAEKVLREEAPQPPPPGQAAPAAEFFDAFRHLEKLIRDYLRERELYVPSRGAPRMSFSFRQMIEALLQNEKIDREFFEELLEINKYRNLVFHGHIETADPAMVAKVRAASARVQQLE